MALWVFGPLISLLLLQVIAQLWSIGKRLEARGRLPERAVATSLEADVWLSELEAKGEELLARMEEQRAAVEALVASSPAPPQVSTKPSVGSRYERVQERVVELARQGMAAPAIAQSLGLGRGEVQLLMRLDTDQAKVSWLAADTGR